MATLADSTSHYAPFFEMFLIFNFLANGQSLFISKIKCVFILLQKVFTCLKHFFISKIFN
jgi:hypothetical protein